MFPSLQAKAIRGCILKITRLHYAKLRKGHKAVCRRTRHRAHSCPRYRSEPIGLAQMASWGSVSEPGQAGWQNSADYRSQHWYWERDSCGYGLSSPMPTYPVCPGARVILACRDLNRANMAAEEIRQRSGNGNVVVKKLDLSSLQSVRDMAKDIQENEERLDVLINNAGVLMCPKWRTEEGFEMQFGVNHLGHFLLTDCLLDLLKTSAPSRIVSVSSLAHERGRIHFDDINLDKDYDPQESYRQSKLANVLFSRELAVRLQGTGVTVYSLHPGVIRTEIGRHLLPTLPLWKRALFVAFMSLVKSSWEGAQTTIYCAVDESLGNASGLYYSDCAPKEPAPQARDDIAARKLWDLSASMVGVA